MPKLTKDDVLKKAERQRRDRTCVQHPARACFDQLKDPTAG